MFSATFKHETYELNMKTYSKFVNKVIKGYKAKITTTVSLINILFCSGLSISPPRKM